MPLRFSKMSGQAEPLSPTDKAIDIDRRENGQHGRDTTGQGSSHWGQQLPETSPEYSRFQFVKAVPTLKTLASDNEQSQRRYFSKSNPCL